MLTFLNRFGTLHESSRAKSNGLCRSLALRKGVPKIVYDKGSAPINQSYDSWAGSVPGEVVELPTLELD